MASFFVSADDSDGATVTGNENVFLVPEGVILSNIGSAFVFDNGVDDTTGIGNRLIVEGFVGSANETGVTDTGMDGENNSVTVTDTGTIFGGIDLDADGVDGYVVNNHGLIDGGGVGVRIFNDFGAVVNTGTIFGGATGVVLVGLAPVINNSGEIFGGATGLASNGAAASITNSGTIHAQGVGVRVEGDGTQFVNTGSILGGAAPSSTASGGLFEGDNIVIRNFGEMSGDKYGIYGEGADINLFNQGDVSGGQMKGIRLEHADNARVVNEGTAIGQIAGIEVAGDSAKIINNGLASGQNGILLQGTGLLQLVNTGEIVGSDGAGVFSGTTSTPVQVRNTGTISGDEFAITLGAGDDVVRNAGLIEGDIDLSFGDDFYREGSTGQTDGNVLGGLGMDTMIGGAEEDVFLGEAGNDSLRGKGNDDVLQGGDGDDFMDGGAGDDVLSGGADNDRLRGEGGDDVLRGNDGDDQLRADTGEDLLFGGTGNDTLRGGEDADIFGFEQGDGLDRIIDFEDNVDTLDLTDYGFSSVADVVALGRETPQGDVVLELTPTDEIRISGINLLALQDDILI
ncbi:MAG: hypothetical protein AcusKO_48920 [Acuticoccus sp.]